MTAVIGQAPEIDPEERRLNSQLARVAAEHRSEVAAAELPQLPSELQDLINGSLLEKRTKRFLHNGSWKQAVRDMRKSSNLEISRLALILECNTPNVLDR